MSVYWLFTKAQAFTFILYSYVTFNSKSLSLNIVTRWFLLLLFLALNLNLLLLF